MHIDSEDMKSCTLHISEGEWQEFIDLYESFWDKCAEKFGYGSVEEAMQNRRFFTIRWKKHEISMDTSDPRKEIHCHWRGTGKWDISDTIKGSHEERKNE